MIKHGKIYKVSKTHMTTYLAPIMEFVTKGVADAKEKVVLSPKACDVRGAQRFNAQMCVIARNLTRERKPEAVSVGRTLAYAVFDGLAIRFRMPHASRAAAEMFDQSGRVKRAHIELWPINKTWLLRTKQRGSGRRSGAKKGPKLERARRWGVRAIGGGVVLKKRNRPTIPPS